MSEDQTYGVQLDLLTQNYNKKLKDVVNTTQMQAKLIEQKAKVNFGGYSPFASMRDLNLSSQSGEVESYQTQIKNVLSDLKMGNIDTSQAKSSLNDLLNDIKLTNDTFAKYTNTRIKINVDDSELSLLQQAGVNTQLIDNYVQITNQDLDKTSENVTKLENNLGKAANEAQKFSQTTNSASKSTSELGQNFEKTMNKGVGSTRRLLFSLFSVHSVWSLISRASSNTLTINDALNSRVNVLNSALGNAVLPIVQKVVGYLEYAVIFGAKIIQFFTGYNALANLTTSNIKNATKSAKELNKTLAGFDEINNIGQTSKGSLAGGVKSDMKALNDFYKKIEEVEQWMNKSGIYGFLEKVKVGFNAIWEAVKPLWDYALKPMLDFALNHPKVLSVLFSIFLGNKLMNGINNVLGTTSTGLIGTHSILNKIAGIGVITILFTVGNIIADLNEIKDIMEKVRNHSYENKKNWLEHETDLKRIYDTMGVNNQNGLDSIEKANKLLEGTNGWWDKIFHYSDEHLANMEQVVIDSQVYYDKLVNIYKQGGLNNDEQITLLNNLYKQVETNDKIIDRLKQQGKDTSELERITNNYKGLTKEVYDNLIDQGVTHDDIYQKIGLEENKILKMTNTNYTCEIDVNANTNPASAAVGAIIGGNYETEIKVEADTKPARNSFKEFFKGIASGPAVLLDGLGFSGLKKWVNSFDVGTNYVPNDQLAMVHKGEMIIPAKYNPTTSGINGGHDEEIIQAIYELKETLENKDMNAYISEDDIGRASSNYRSRRSRQLGKDVG